MMADKLTRWDPSEQLRTHEDVVAYLQAIMEEDDVELLKAAIGDVARGIGMTEIARKTGMSRESLYKALDIDDDLSQQMAR
jgi:probable addiction module antidote protein